LQQPPPEPNSTSRPPTPPDLLAGQQLPPPPQQERSSRKRDALLRSALQLFAERGYEGTTIEDIAHQAGVAVGGFYQHFASKRQILLVLMDRLVQEASAVAGALVIRSANSQQIRDTLAQLVRQALQVDWAYTGAYHAWREAAVHDRELQLLSQNIEAWVVHQLKLLFHGLLHLPGARQEVDRDTLAWEIALLFLRLAETPLADANPVVASLTALLYHGLFIDRDV
jgi:AcrR family transcriptional regulator